MSKKRKSSLILLLATMSLQGQDQAKKLAIIKELNILSENDKQAIPGRTLVGLRTRVSDAAAKEVQDEIKRLLQGDEKGIRWCAKPRDCGTLRWGNLGRR